MAASKVKRPNRGERTLEHLRSGGTAFSVQRAFTCTTPSKWISDARTLAAARGLAWIEGKVRCSDGRTIKEFHVAEVGR